MDTELAQAILRQLSGGEDRSTGQLAAATRRPHPKVFATCKALEARGRLTSRLVPTRERVYVLRVTGEAVTRASHGRLQQILADLRGMIAASALPDRETKGFGGGDPDLCEKVSEYLEDLIARAASARIKDRIREFLAEFMAICRGAKKKSELRALLGLLPTPARARLWRLRS